MELKVKLEKRIENFWGYGNLSSQIWHIGMEEGLRDDEEDFNNRINNTYAKNVIDIVTDMQGVKDHLKWFNGSIPLQTTWRLMIRIHLTITGHKNITSELMKEYQKNYFGRTISDHCILELMPLPAKSISKLSWFYDKYELPILKNRNIYENKIKPQRSSKLKTLINTYKPKCVVFYSKLNLDDWKKIINKDISYLSNNVQFAFNNDINYFILPHPGMHGLTNNDWDEFGKLISDKVRGV